VALRSQVKGVSVSVVDRWQNGVGLQLASASPFSSTNVGPAGRRRPALFGVGWPARVPSSLAKSVSHVGR
jgi:hypothetical protein